MQKNATFEFSAKAFYLKGSIKNYLNIPVFTDNLRHLYDNQALRMIYKNTVINQMVIVNFFMNTGPITP